MLLFNILPSIHLLFFISFISHSKIFIFSYSHFHIHTLYVSLLYFNTSYHEKKEEAKKSLFCWKTKQPMKENQENFHHRCIHMWLLTPRARISISRYEISITGLCTHKWLINFSCSINVCIETALFMCWMQIDLDLCLVLNAFNFWRFLIFFCWKIV